MAWQFSLYRGCFPYILLLLRRRISFLYRSSLCRDSNVFFFSPSRWRFQRRKEFVQMCANTKEARGSGLLGLVSLNP